MTAVADNIVSDYGLTSVDGDVEKAIDKAIKDAVAKENEACAKAVEKMGPHEFEWAAARIRRRKK